MRPSGRKSNEIRNVNIEIDVNEYAEGACLISYGKTKLLCTATVDERVPPFLRNSNSGWVTAEYGMLPRSTHSRMGREAVRGKQGGRTQEIQRLIGRSLRSVVDLNLLGERQIIIDCDVINADGGTRTAAITGGYIALYLAVKNLRDTYNIKKNPINKQLAAISCGIYGDQAIVDLDYIEDSNAQADANFVLTSCGDIVEIQGTAEDAPFSEEKFIEMLALAKGAVLELSEFQNDIINKIEGNDCG